MEGNFITQGLFSVVVLALLPNFPCFDLATVKPCKVGQADELCDASVTMLLQTQMSQLTSVAAGSDSTRSSTCVPKTTDVCYSEVASTAVNCFHDAAVCKQFDSAPMFGDSLYLGYDPDSRTLCISGSGVQTRALSTVQMIRDAVRSLDQDCKSLSQFARKVIYIHDQSYCQHDMAYSLTDSKTMLLRLIPDHAKSKKVCKTRLIPDHAFYKWPEAGLLPDYEHLTTLLRSLGSHPATERRCGWAGNPITNQIRRDFVNDPKFKQSALFNIVVPESSEGPGGQNGRISMEDQVKRWACFVELPGYGYSGRMPYLLHSGRPILMVEREPGLPMSATWYSHLLKPWVHYIPVLHDMSDLEEKANFALGITPGSNATKIGAAAKEFAQTHLEYHEAVKYLADSLLELKDS